MSYSFINGRFHYNNNTGDYFDFEGFVNDTWGGGSFIAGETISPGNPKGWKYKFDSLPNSYVEIFTATNSPGSIYDAPGYDFEYLAATSYYDAYSGRYLSTTGLDEFDIGAPYFGDLEGELFTDGIAYKFDINTTVDLPVVVSSPSPTPSPDPTPAPIPTPTPTPDLTSNIDSDSIIEVPIDKKWAKNLWKFSGKDDIINVHIDSEGSFKKKSKKVSTSHQNFYESVFQEIEDATDLEIEFTDSNDADIIIHNTGKRGSASKKKGYFDVNGGKIGRKRLNDERREYLASNILTCFGLDYFEKNDAHSSDDSLMSYYLSESGYNGLTSSDIAALQSLW